ncbi:hypothetical protein DCO58_09395 [Helicobacter saguini]|uniref:Lipoprotein LPP20-like domain-containing protein n=1 Tax=Helicobacter saguini TaxID=1548018 RepID=A0A347VP88_9HELI|nr:LPP20 family lipoprotein [Helicobacter saguini]MWV61467.1 hypothetical protein [Helicobacter saguini]MWV67861.1 hypothetical protein [Helicobacter saguini]MWV70670.1 hypothetical protein [Helicobacter saguini]MWV72574.1 hypothetical protein [Helicobacter saguini]TLD94693.1 hypothetical protein LS64_003980 [Helicobacter saguini]
MRVFRAILCVLMVCFVGCGGAISGVKKDSKTPQYLYGQGSGSSFEVAKAEAIKDLSTNLQVSVKYNAVDNTRQNNDKLSTTGYSNIALESQIKDLPSIEVVKNVKKGNIYQAQVRVDKNILQDSIFTRLNASESVLDSILQECGTPSFSTFEKFKKVLREYKRDVNLYQIISKNASFNAEKLNDYEKIANNKPRYNVITNADSVGLNPRIASITLSEIDKFITLDSNAKSALFVGFDEALSDNFRIDFRFFSCKGDSKLDSAISVNTHIKARELGEEKNLRRIGPIIYKAIKDHNETYNI